MNKEKELGIIYRKMFLKTKGGPLLEDEKTFVKEEYYN